VVEAVIAVIAVIIVGAVFAYFYFKAKAKAAAGRLGEEAGRGHFEQRKVRLEDDFVERHRAFIELWKAEAEKRLREEAEKLKRRRQAGEVGGEV